MRLQLVAEPLCVAVIPCLPAQAQSAPPMDTDRPTQSAATIVIPSLRGPKTS